jgi:hypothetical protein
MNKLYMNLLRRLLSATVLNSVIICIKNIGLKVDHLQFRTCLVEGLLVLHSVLTSLTLKG